MPPVAAAITTNSNDAVAVVVATLDLHGFRKEAAIGKLTVFLEEAVRRHGPPTTAATQRRHRRRGGGAQDDSPERSCSSELQAVWVSVITGTGSHGQHGPVLRNAVKTLLEKRGMSYRLAHGCFTINANSGMILLPPPLPTDTKVIVVENTLGIKPSCSSTAVMARMSAAPILGTIRSSSTISSSSADPTPRQVHEDDQLVEHVQQTSMVEFRSLTKQQHEERVQLNRALSRSQHDEEERRKRLEREEEQSIAQALKKSQQGAIAAAHSTIESSTNDADEEEQRLLQQAMSESQQEFQQWTEEERAKEELELQGILTASRHEAYAVLSSQEEEAQLLQQAISMSLQERNLQYCVTTDENDAGLINHNLVSDNNDCNNMDDEEVQLRRILEQSCQEF